MAGFLYVPQHRVARFEELLEGRDLVLWAPAIGSAQGFDSLLDSPSLRFLRGRLDAHRAAHEELDHPFFWWCSGQEQRIVIVCFYRPGTILCPRQISKSNLLLRLYGGQYVVEVHPDAPESHCNELLIGLETLRAEPHNLARIYTLVV